MVIDKETNYYPFGLEHADYNGTGTQLESYRYGFQGQEKQKETGWSSFKWRNAIPELGRFFGVDPLSEKYAYQSHYNFSENRVNDGRELEGLEHISMHVRHFIPDKSVALGRFRGDNRPFTTDLSKNTTSRINHNITIDASNGTYTKSTYSDKTTLYVPMAEGYESPVTSRATPNSSVNVTTDKKGNFELASKYNASDPLAPGAPDIDFANKYSVSIDLNNRQVTVSGQTTGDPYPAAESFVTDEHGNSVFVGVSPAVGNITDSYGNNNKTLINNTVSIQTNADGTSFTGVYGNNGSVISIKEHNEKYQNQQANK